ncbi:hypothetical protein [Mucilaginibacter pedocola]|uniref:Uncharacterized protein n=1 Tax=Mucilaginibacter pedocola TaxID=1792845 RepID=A0A1S9P971_9SPHI|nr:hypothetical protein [Mucilaginibacter pedocola]OOQ57377.1 hypothetical protein BC343_14850 [Mucilaginibacter pedocola]
MITLKNRPGLTPRELNESDMRNHCPDILETEEGDFIVIGKEVAANEIDLSKFGASLDDNEKIILIPRITLFSAINGLKENHEI